MLYNTAISIFLSNKLLFWQKPAFNVVAGRQFEIV